MIGFRLLICARKRALRRLKARGDGVLLRARDIYFSCGTGTLACAGSTEFIRVRHRQECLCHATLGWTPFAFSFSGCIFVANERFPKWESRIRLPPHRGVEVGQVELLQLSRRDFLGAALAGAACLGAAAPEIAPVVSVVKIKNDNIQAAVEQAMDLLGGIESVTKGKERIMLKPNLVSPLPQATTKREVIATLAKLMQAAHKEVSIGEGSAAAEGFNVKGTEVFRTRNRDILSRMQSYVFDQLGYSELGKALRIPLVNLHSGEMARVRVPNGFVFDEVTIHRSLTEIDLLCSVPIMKTHTLAQVTLGMKNLVGVFPGTVYCSVRGCMHDFASKVEPSGTAAPVVDMVRANKLGLVVVNASTAMEGEGPSSGTPVNMGLIIAGTNPLATDMVSASLMGFEPEEIPTFMWANRAGMKPARLDEIEVRGEKPDQVRRKFVRPQIRSWPSIRDYWGVKQIY